MEFIKQNTTAILIVGVLALSFFIVTNVLVNSSAEPFTPEVIERTVKLEVDAHYFVTVGDEVVFTDEASLMSREEAVEHCETMAYAADNMWKQVVCTFSGKEIYNDIFIAG